MFNGAEVGEGNQGRKETTWLFQTGTLEEKVQTLVKRLKITKKNVPLGVRKKKMGNKKMFHAIFPYSFFPFIQEKGQFKNAFCHPLQVSSPLLLSPS